MNPFVLCGRSVCIGLVLMAALLSGCGREALQEPTITDTTVPWTVPGLRVFTANTAVPSGWTIQESYVRFTRHSWPGPAAANEAVATETSPGSGAFATPPGAVPAIVHSDAVFYEWFLDYKLAAGGSEILTARSGMQRFVNGCTPAQTRAVLIGAATVLRSRFITTTPQVTLLAQGYAIPPHFNVSLAGAGVGFAAVQAGFSLTTPDINNPDLVLYRPRPAFPGETAAQRFTAITDPLFADAPYTLIGAAYGTLFDPDNRPFIQCIPSDRWIVHEAGYHLANGNMVLTPPNDNGVAGSANITVPPAGIPPGVWHPRFWDLHLWLPANGDPAAIMAINDPGGTVGIFLPPGTFFSPRTFQ